MPVPSLMPHQVSVSPGLSAGLCWYGNVFVCAAWRGRHRPHVATECLKCGRCNCELNFTLYLALFNLNLNSLLWLEAGILDSAVM